VVAAQHELEVSREPREGFIILCFKHSCFMLLGAGMTSSKRGIKKKGRHMQINTVQASSNIY